MKKSLFLIGLLTFPLFTSCNTGKMDVFDQMNAVLDAVREDIKTPYDAVRATSHLTDELELGQNEEIAYDSLNKKFVIMNGDTIVRRSANYIPSTRAIEYFKFVTSYDTNSKYSQYMLPEASGAEQLLITTGFDAGTHKDYKNISYANESNDDGQVIVRAYSDYFTVLAPYQTVHHYNTATNILVTDCKDYYEHGVCAYMKVTKGTVNFSDDDTVEVDILEKAVGHENDSTLVASENVKIHSSVNLVQGADKDFKAKPLSLTQAEIRNSEGFRTAVSTPPGQTGFSNFIRLQSDIIFEKQAGGNDLESITIERSLCIDLNGFKLSLKDFALSSKSQIREAIRVQSVVKEEKGYDAYVYIIDSQGVLDEHSGISLVDCSIVVAGASEKATSETPPASRLILNSGKITQTVTSTSIEVGAAINVIGKTNEEIATKDVGFTMYGGKIQCTNETYDEGKYGCICAAGSGANINIAYGILISTDFCIYGLTPNDTYPQLDEATVSILDADLTSERNTCIYFPAKGNLSISGGSFTGSSCITCVAGDVNISGDSEMIANGTGTSYITKNYDGSVIYIPKDYAGVSQYGDLNITVESSILKSNHEYICHVKDLSSNTTYVKLSFNSGTYSYKMGDGLNIESSSKVQVLRQEGSWTKIIY